MGRGRPEIVLRVIRSGGIHHSSLRIGEKPFTGFDPIRDLARIGLANRRPMLDRVAGDGEKSLKGSHDRRGAARTSIITLRRSTRLAARSQGTQDALVALLREG